MSFLPIGETLKQGSWRGPTKGVYLSLRVEKVLNELLPQLLPSIAERLKMYSLRDGKLSLLTPSPTVSQEVYLNSAVIIKEVNRTLGEKVIEKLGFKIEPTKP